MGIQFLLCANKLDGFTANRAARERSTRLLRSARVGARVAARAADDGSDDSCPPSADCRSGADRRSRGTPPRVPTSRCSPTYCRRRCAGARTAHCLAALVRSRRRARPRGVADPAVAFSKLHLRPEGQRFQQQAGGTHAHPKGRAARCVRQAVHAKVSGCRIPRPARRDAARLVRDAVLPAVDELAHGFHALVYQATPSLRIHMPRTRPSIGLHRDFDYYHQPTEINVWVPLVPLASGTNSLYCESVARARRFSAIRGTPASSSASTGTSTPTTRSSTRAT